MKIKELFTDESKWTKNAYAKDQDGNDCPFHNDKATQFCLLGAVLRCYDDNYLRYHITEKISKKLKDGIVSWNDSFERKFQDIKTLVEELDI